MKSPSRMRSLDNLSNMKSSAFEVKPISPDDPETSRQQGSSNYLVSSRYNRRTVKFRMPESAGSDLKFGDLKDTKLPNGLKSSEVFEDQQNNGKAISAFYDIGLRRMSAPELPPISTTGKPILVNNGLVTPRSNTVHPFDFNSRGRHRNSIHSDSSLKGYSLTVRSGCSSTNSSQRSRGRVLSAGANKETLTADLARNIQQRTTSKVDTTNMRDNMALSVAQRSVSGVTGVGRQSTKLSLKENSTPRSSLTHSKSEAQLTARTRYPSEPSGLTQPSQPMRRNFSDRSLTDKKNARNNINNKITLQKTKNGLKKNKSSNGFITNLKDDRGSEDDILDRVQNGDSDSDGDSHHRVMQWIVGTADAEPPEEPEIVHIDEPPQRDTAIRIVYDEEKS